MAIILPPKVVSRAAARFTAKKMISEQTAPPGMEAHIYNLYEDLSMPLGDIIEIARLGLQGKIRKHSGKD